MNDERGTMNVGYQRPLGKFIIHRSALIVLLLLATCHLSLATDLCGQTPIVKAIGDCFDNYLVRWDSGEGKFVCGIPLISGIGTPGQTLISNGTQYDPADPPSGGVPTGAILLIVSGGCPTGFNEATELDGVTLIGTLSAHGDVGTTGGSDTITPTGTVSQPTFAGNFVSTSSDTAGTPAGTVSQPTFTGAALGTHLHGVGTYAASAPTFTGSVLGTHLHGVGSYANTAITAGTPAGTIAWPAGVPTFAGSPFSDVINHTHSVNVGSANDISSTTGAGNFFAGTTSSVVATAANPAGGVASITPAGTNSWPAGVPAFSGSALGTHNHTFSGSSEAVSAGTPGGTNSAPALSGSSEAISAGTPAGTVSQPTFSGSALAAHAHSVTATGSVSQPTFSGAGADNRSAFVKVIFCKKT